MADNGSETNGQNMGSYATRHPGRMASGMLLVGTAIGASIMAAKKNRDPSYLQKFMDNMSKGH